VPDDLLTILSAHAELPHRTEWFFAAGGDDPPHQNTGAPLAQHAQGRRAPCGTSTRPD
jgi:hypothetical protein